jgi:hypothetical protein
MQGVRGPEIQRLSVADGGPERGNVSVLLVSLPRSDRTTATRILPAVKIVCARFVTPAQLPRGPSPFIPLISTFFSIF